MILEVLAAAAIWMKLLGNLSERTYYQYSMSGLIIGLFLSFFLFLWKRIEKSVFAVWMGILILGVLNNAVVGQIQLPRLLIILLTYFPIAATLVVVEKPCISLWWGMYLSTNLFIMYQYLKGNGTQLFYAESNNIVSVYLVIFLFTLILAHSKTGKQVPFWTCIVFCAECILAVGRGGIICALFYAFFYYIYREYLLKGKRINAHIWKIVGMGIPFLVLMAFAWNTEYIINTFFSRFVSGVEFIQGSSRLEMIIQYLSVLPKSMTNFFLGINTRELSSLAAHFSGNVHNSYMMTHAAFGLIGILCTFTSALKSMAVSIRTRNYEVAIILATFFLRAISDNIFPYSLGTIIPLFCIISTAKRKKNVII